MRHEIAHVWDIIYNNSVGAVIHTWRDVMKWWHSLKNDEIGILGAARHDIAAIWDAIWNNTVGRTQRGIADIVAWEKTLPRRTIDALSGFGHGLAAFASAAFGEMWNAIKNVAGNIWHWLTGWVSSLPGFLKKLLGIHSPSSVFYDIGKQMMMGLFHGIQDHAHHAANAARSATSGFADTGARSGSAALAQSFAASVLPRGWSFADLLALWNQESGWNAYAVNPSSGAYGIPQSLGHGHPYNLGDYKAQIMWGLNYIAGRYYNSQGAWAHEQAFGWYDRGGWLPTGLSLALNTTGRPERVGGGGGGGDVYITVNVPPTVNPRDAGRQVADLLKAHVKSGGTVFPAGVTPR
jgi:uncharacterized membrane protein